MEYTLKNGLKLIYKKRISKLTSICIGINGGACRENELLGVAHATEHLVYKGTKNRSEEEINKELTEIFGFQNAMTNYPYVIYYGTLLSEDFKRGVELFSDILINPEFNEEGFYEEMEVIKEELLEWDEDIEQFCEDKLFLNTFNKRRLKYPIIGEMSSLEKITLDDIKTFYKENYHPKNTYIAVISELEFEEVLKNVEECFGEWESPYDYNYPTNYEFQSGTYIDERIGGNSSRVEIIAPIDKLNDYELKCLRIFNQYFGEGVNSLLYDTLRTKNSLVYDVISKIANEGNIKLYKIEFTVGKENVETALNLIKEKIASLSEMVLRDKEIGRLSKGVKLKRLFREEQSIVLAKELSTYGVMFGTGNKYLEEIEGLENVIPEDVISIGQRVLSNISIQIINSL